MGVLYLAVKGEPDHTEVFDLGKLGWRFTSEMVFQTVRDIDWNDALELLDPESAQRIKDGMCAWLGEAQFRIVDDANGDEYYDLDERCVTGSIYDEDHDNGVFKRHEID